MAVFKVKTPPWLKKVLKNTAAAYNLLTLRSPRANSALVSSRPEPKQSDERQAKQEVSRTWSNKVVSWSRSEKPPQHPKKQNKNKHEVWTGYYTFALNASSTLQRTAHSGPEVRKHLLWSRGAQTFCPVGQQQVLKFERQRSRSWRMECCGVLVVCPRLR